MIEIRTHNDFAKQAALNGVKIDFKHVRKKFQELSNEQKKLMADVIKKAAQRKVDEKAEKARKKNGDN